MASIQILSLYPAGSELFRDSESFMTEITDDELSNVNGGNWKLTYLVVPPIQPYPTLSKLLKALTLQRHSQNIPT